MKKNIIITILILIILILIFKLLNPSVVTQRKQPQINVQTSESSQDNEQKQKKHYYNNYKNSSSPLQPEFKLNDENTKLYEEQNNNTSYETNFNSDNNDKITFSPQKEIRHPEDYNDSSPKRKEFNKPIHINEFQPQHSTQYNNPITMCKPYKETLTTEYMGMNMTYTIDILGWVNNKCVLNFEANMNGAGSTFYEEYGINADMAQVFGFAPKVRCEFTKQQLLYVGDNILQESNRNKKMLKNPDQIEFPQWQDLSFSDLKLLQIILNDKACKVINTDDFVQMFEGLFQF